MSAGAFGCLFGASLEEIRWNKREDLEAMIHRLEELELSQAAVISQQIQEGIFQGSLSISEVERRREYVSGLWKAIEYAGSGDYSPSELKKEIERFESLPPILLGSSSRTRK